MSLRQEQTFAAILETVRDWKGQGARIALVPTMGALHEGHIALVHHAREIADFCIVSIFVNPTQFAPHEDFDAYPRTLDSDLKKLEDAGAHVAYTPAAADLYPNGATETAIRPGMAAQGLESDFRPHFFAGVVNVVSRLFAATEPNVAIFGEKDFQQLQVIREMVETYNMPVEIIGAPTIRDAHGLALSSRNTYLSPPELETARLLNGILRKAAIDHDLEAAKAAILAAGFDRVDYVERRWNRILAAAWLGRTRLIDNVSVMSSPA